MAGQAILNTNKKVILDTKRNIFGLTDVTMTLRFGNKKKVIPMTEVVDNTVQDFANSVTVTTAAAKGTYALVLSDVTDINPNDVLKVGNEYVVVKTVDSGTNTVSLRYKLSMNHAVNEEVHKVGNTGFYEAVWTVNLNDPDLGPLNIGDTILVDISSVSGGFLFEGQTLVIVDNNFVRFNTIDSKLDEVNTKLDSMIGWSDDDLSRVLV